MARLHFLKENHGAVSLAPYRRRNDTEISLIVLWRAWTNYTPELTKDAALVGTSAASFLMVKYYSSTTLINTARTTVRWRYSPVLSLYVLQVINVSHEYSSCFNTEDTADGSTVLFS